MRLLVFDIETRRLAQDLGCRDKPCMHENDSCGWDALKRGEGGLSVIAVWDSTTRRVHFYDMHNILACVMHLEMGDIVVGYNSEEFDVKPLEHLVGRKLVLKCHIDLLQLIWNALRLQNKRLKGNTLNDVCMRTLGRGKSGESKHAPQLADEGRWAELFDYCVGDVYLTLDLFYYIIEHGGIIGLDGTFVPITLPRGAYGIQN
jgi:hypothetical protein